MKCKIANFSVIDNNTVSLISVTYHTYDDNGNILRSNMKKSIMINDDPVFIIEDGTEFNVKENLAYVAQFILNELEQA